MTCSTVSVAADCGGRSWSWTKTNCWVSFNYPQSSVYKDYELEIPSSGDHLNVFGVRERKSWWHRTNKILLILLFIKTLIELDSWNMYCRSRDRENGDGKLGAWKWSKSATKPIKVTKKSNTTCKFSLISTVWQFPVSILIRRGGGGEWARAYQLAMCTWLLLNSTVQQPDPEEQWKSCTWIELHSDSGTGGKLIKRHHFLMHILYGVTRTGTKKIGIAVIRIPSNALVDCKVTL